MTGVAQRSTLISASGLAWGAATRGACAAAHFEGMIIVGAARQEAAREQRAQCDASKILRPNARARAHKESPFRMKHGAGYYTHFVWRARGNARSPPTPGDPVVISTAFSCCD